MRIGEINKHKMLTGHLKGIVRAEVREAEKMNRMRLEIIKNEEKKRRGVFKELGREFSILRVESSLVDAKNLNKYLKKVIKKDYEKEEMKYLLSEVVRRMQHSLDEVNVKTVLVIMMKKNMKEEEIFNQMVPLFYKIRDFDKMIDCLLYGSMLMRENESLKALATKIVLDLPDYGNSISYSNMGKLCEAMCNLNLYSTDFAQVVESLICEESLKRNRIEGTNFCSMLSYISRSGVLDENSWRLYTKYSLSNILSCNHKVVMKLLECYVTRNMYNRKLFKSCGDLLIKSIEAMHPKEVAKMSYLYFKTNFKHEELLKEIFKTAERIAVNLDGQGSLQLLSGYHLYFSSLQVEGPGSEGRDIPPGEKLSDHLNSYRALYMIYNGISKDLNSLKFEDFVLLFKTMQLFPFINTKNLQSNLRTFFSISVNPDKPLSNLDQVRMRFRQKRAILQAEEAFFRQIMP